MPDDVVVTTPEGDKLHFPDGTDQQTITSAMGKFRAQKVSGGAMAPKQIQIPDAAMQAHQQLIKNNAITNAPLQALTFTPTGTPGLLGSVTPGNTATVPPEIADQINKQKFKTGVETVGAFAGGEAAAPLVGAAKAAPWIVRALAQNAPVGAGVGLGNAVGQAATTGTVNPSESAGMAAATTATGMALQGIPPLAKWITSSKSAGAKLLQQASEKAGSAPIPISHNTDVLVDEIVQQAKLGGGPIPAPITALLDRLGPSTRQAAEAAPGPLTYDEARILQSNSSSLSANEAANLKGRMKYLMPQFAKSLAQDVQQGANQAGIGDLHSQGMQEYALASARNRAIAKGAKIAGVGTGIAIGEHLAKKAIQAVAK